MADFEPTLQVILQKPDGTLVWVGEFSAVAEALFLPTGALDFPTSGATASNPPVNRRRVFLDVATGQFKFKDDTGAVFAFNGANAKRITAGPYTLLASDDVLFVNTDAGDVTVNLPAGIAGTNYKVINVGSSANDVTLDPNGAEQVWGQGAGVAVTLGDGDILDLHFETTEGWW